MPDCQIRTAAIHLRIPASASIVTRVIQWRATIDAFPKSVGFVMKGRARRLLPGLFALSVGCSVMEDAASGSLVEVWSVPVDSLTSTNRVQLIAHPSCGVWLLDVDGAHLDRWTCDGGSLAPLQGTDGEGRRFREPSLLVALSDTVAVWDLFSQRVTLFDTHGTLLGAWEHDVRRAIHGFVRSFADPEFSRFCTERRPKNVRVKSTEIMVWERSSSAAWVPIDSTYGAPLLRISVDSASIEIPTFPALRPYCFFDSRGRLVIARNTDRYVYTHGVDGVRTDTIQALEPRPIHTPTLGNVVAAMSTSLPQNDSIMSVLASQLIDAIGEDTPIVEGSAYFEHAAMSAGADEIWFLAYRDHEAERRFTVFAMDGTEWLQGTVGAHVAGEVVDFAVHASYVFVLERERPSQLRLRAFARRSDR